MLMLVLVEFYSGLQLATLRSFGHNSVVPLRLLALRLCAFARNKKYLCHKSNPSHPKSAPSTPGVASHPADTANPPQLICVH